LATEERTIRSSRKLSSPLEKIDNGVEGGKNAEGTVHFSSGSINMHLTFSRDDIMISIHL
jgi:hypothetical protein